MREIKDILHFRNDISPFLIHLTRAIGDTTAKANLESILGAKRLEAGKSHVSDARFGMITLRLEEEKQKKLFDAVCFTETPLGEAHCLLEILYRTINLEPYGLVFLKELLQKRGVSPVLHLNNEEGGKEELLKALCSLHESHENQAFEMLPLISIFGKKVTPPAATRQTGEVDFRWEREWRYPYARGPLNFTQAEVFVGLCPEDDIAHFKRLMRYCQLLWMTA